MKNSSALYLRSNSSGQRGVALLEVLVAFFVLSIGLLGLAALQLKSVQFNQGSYQRSQAAVAAYDILDRMRLNRSQASAGSYNIAMTATGPGTGNIVQKDLTEWLTVIRTTLPDGQGSIDCDSNKICDVTIRWADRFSSTSGATEELIVSSQIVQ